MADTTASRAAKNPSAERSMFGCIASMAGVSVDSTAVPDFQLLALGFLRSPSAEYQLEENASGGHGSDVCV